MAERTYPFGYGTQRCTWPQLNTKWTWTHLHPEMRRRVLRMMDHAQDAGYDVGIGEGARSTTTQRTTFLARHNVVSSGGCCHFEGKRYQLKKGLAHAAPPGSSVHEDGLLDGFALAVDMVGWENHWFDKNCTRYGLKNFGGVRSARTSMVKNGTTSRSSSATADPRSGQRSPRASSSRSGTCPVNRLSRPFRPSPRHHRIRHHRRDTPCLQQERPLRQSRLPGGMHVATVR